ncbi:PLD nuclease N-terminal domain-containing protein [Longibacter sp.]|uniref:PLD nuclease N-terminal domain-containing protein n=1 Tax=Longibacter sp. TaxID=2045415 RepID=UPI003EBCC42C
MSTPSTDSLSFLDRLARIPAALWVLLGIGTMVLSGCGMNLVDRIQQPQWGICGTLVIVLDIVALVDLIGDRGRSAANKIIWSLVIIFMPIVGVLLYFFIGR